MAVEKDKKIDLDLDAPTITLAFIHDAVTPSVPYPQLIKELAKYGYTYIEAKGTHRKTIKTAHADTWLITLYPAYTTKDGLRTYDNSAELYKACKKSRKITVVSDECSINRAEKLYPLLRELELHFRKLALERGISLDGFAAKKRKDLSDHLVNMLQSTELFGQMLLGPASDTYFLEQVAAATTDEERLAARTSTRADEYGFGEFKDFFKKLPALRNKVMHFRVITPDEYETALQDIHNLQVNIEAKEFTKFIEISADAFIKMQENIRAVTEQLTRSYINLPEIDFSKFMPAFDAGQSAMEKMSAMVGPITAAQDAMQSAFKPMLDAQTKMWNIYNNINIFPPIYPDDLKEDDDAFGDEEDDEPDTSPAVVKK